MHGILACKTMELMINNRLRHYIDSLMFTINNHKHRLGLQESSSMDFEKVYDLVCGRGMVFKLTDRLHGQYY